MWYVGIDGGWGSETYETAEDALNVLIEDIEEEIDNLTADRDEYSYPGLTLYDLYSSDTQKLNNLINVVERMLDNISDETPLGNQIFDLEMYSPRYLKGRLVFKVTNSDTKPWET